MRGREPHLCRVRLCPCDRRAIDKPLLSARGVIAAAHSKRYRNTPQPQEMILRLFFIPFKQKCIKFDTLNAKNAQLCKRFSLIHRRSSVASFSPCRCSARLPALALAALENCFAASHTRGRASHSDTTFSGRKVQDSPQHSRATGTRLQCCAPHLLGVSGVRRLQH